jgi:hypothetical protein
MPTDNVFEYQMVLKIAVEFMRVKEMSRVEFDPAGTNR